MSGDVPLYSVKCKQKYANQILGYKKYKMLWNSWGRIAMNMYFLFSLYIMEQTNDTTLTFR